jgi:hypothetical protein
MIALSTIAQIKCDELFKRRDEIIAAIEKGSVITIDAGIIALSKVASCSEEYCNGLFPYLMDFLG